MDQRYIGNYHTHTCRCGHAGGTPTEFAAVAADCGMKELGITDHMPYDDDRYGDRMRMHEFSDYLLDIRQAQRYYPALKIYAGLECEYLPHKRGHLEQLRSQLDYLVLGQHFFVDGRGQWHNTYALPNTELFIPYAQSVCDGLATGLFSCLAHPDLIALHDYPADESFIRAVNLILDAAERYQVPLEINANGVRRGLHDFYSRNGEGHCRDYLYPDSRFFQMVAQRRLPCVINADAHSPREMCGKHVDDAFVFADKLGLTLLNGRPMLHWFDHSQ